MRMYADDVAARLDSSQLFQRRRIFVTAVTVRATRSRPSAPWRQRRPAGYTGPNGQPGRSRATDVNANRIDGTLFP